jgi:hypothetical protein
LYLGLAYVDPPPHTQILLCSIFPMHLLLKLKQLQFLLLNTFNQVYN